jgi:apolipoprotein N-acyltransferase
VIPVALTAAAGAVLGHANPLLTVPLAVLLLPAGLIWLAMSAPSPGAALRRGYVTALLAFVGCLYWVVVPVRYYGPAPWIIALPCPLLLAGYLALYPAIFCRIVRAYGPSLPLVLTALLAGTAWASLELAIEILFTGFPWLPLAAALVPEPWAVQATGVFGSAMLGGFLVFCAALLTLPARTTRAGRMAKAAGLVLLLVWAGHGHFALQGASSESAQPSQTALAKTARIGLVQGNIDQSLKWDLDFQAETVTRYLRQSQSLLDQRQHDALIWPETALPFFFQDWSLGGDLVRTFAKRTGTPLLTGAPAYTRDTLGDATLFNRAYLLDATGAEAGFYDKAHLVPFGEYVPFGSILPIDKLVAGIGDFAPGQDPSPLKTGNLAMGMLICYEAIFPELAQERVAHGANLLVNISNDAWFGDTSAPWQHLHLAALRAVEQGRWLVRATNTGISAVIDAKGRIRQVTTLNAEAALTAEVGLNTEPTVYHRFFWLWRLTPPCLTVILIALAVRRARHNTQQP